MSGSGQKRSEAVTPKQEAAIAALLTTQTAKAAAKKAKVSDRTLRRWMKEPGFQRAYKSARRSIVEAAVVQLQKAAGPAVRALVRNLKAEKPADQIRSAGQILAGALRAVELDDVAERLNELEARIDAPAGVPGSSDAGNPDEATDATGSSGPAEDVGADPRPAAGGPLEDPGSGGDASGPVATDPLALDGPASFTALFSTGR